MGHLKKLGDKGWAVLDVVGRQSNKLANKLGAEAFWPMPLDKECEKAAAILRTFTREGFQVKSKERNGNNTKSIVKVPQNILQQAKGLAIFTVFRTGFQISGASGSGILIARQPDGTWGPPSGILLHTLGVGFLIGIDIYDTLLILRTQEAVNAFAHPKISIGAELSVAAGPMGSGRALDMGFKDKSPAWAYTKSKGFYAGVALDGTVVIERNDENERFYGRKIKAAELIRGEARRPHGADGLIAVIEVAEGKYTGRNVGHAGPSNQYYPRQSAMATPEDPFMDPSTPLAEQPIASSSRIPERPQSISSLAWSTTAVDPRSGTPPLPVRRYRLATTAERDESPRVDEAFPSPDDKSEPLNDSQSQPGYDDAPPVYEGVGPIADDTKDTEKSQERFL